MKVINKHAYINSRTTLSELKRIFKKFLQERKRLGSELKIPRFATWNFVTMRNTAFKQEVNKWYPLVAEEFRTHLIKEIRRAHTNRNLKVPVNIHNNSSLKNLLEYINRKNYKSMKETMPVTHKVIGWQTPGPGR